MFRLVRLESEEPNRLSFPVIGNSVCCGSGISFRPESRKPLE